jgi:hypothetical protein
MAPDADESATIARFDELIEAAIARSPARRLVDIARPEEPDAFRQPPLHDGEIQG